MREFPASREPGTRQRQVLSVSRLNARVRQLLEQELGDVWVEGEISNLSRPGSGHAYFSLKDARAQVKCALFRNRLERLRFEPVEGAHVLLRARVGLYEPRGDFQLVVQYVEDVGAGALQREFERVKQALDKAGLFDARHKKALPRFPHRVGVITSATGAAIRDVIATFKRRCPAIGLIVYPAAVQGENAVAELIRALRTAEGRRECDVLILARGGGSLEDLHAFNDESLARVLFDCAIPIVSGVGHDVDFTIADFVCDQRAATPTAAAELVSPDAAHWRSRLSQIQASLAHSAGRRLERDAQRLDWLRRRLARPDRLLPVRRERLAIYRQRMHIAATRAQARQRQSLDRLQQGLHRMRPAARLRQSAARLGAIRLDLNRLIGSATGRCHQRTKELAIRLDAISPLKTLDRGYALVTEPDSNRPITRAGREMIGRNIKVRLARGQLLCEVTDSEET